MIPLWKMRVCIICFSRSTYVGYFMSSNPEIDPSLYITSVGSAAPKALVFKDFGCRKMSVKEIYAATNNLSALNFIGQGIAGKHWYNVVSSCNVDFWLVFWLPGKVYKGVLPDGCHVAIKHIKDGYAETFMREVTSLCHIRHPNLVALQGYCEEEDECFLVYELCTNGNLSEWLFGIVLLNRLIFSSSSSFLRRWPWTTMWQVRIKPCHGLRGWRSRLAVLVAFGFCTHIPKAASFIVTLRLAASFSWLFFLGHINLQNYLTSNMQPTNILLGADLEAKLSDFGLSKVVDVGESHVSSEVRGTFGYVDPEYRQNHRVNAAGDVYSFGIVLLQLLSGKRVVNLNVMRRPMSSSRMVSSTVSPPSIDVVLYSWRKSFPPQPKILTRGEELSDFADPRLRGEYSVEAFELSLKLALSCVAHKQQRPSMEQVVASLETALQISTTTESYSLSIYWCLVLLCMLNLQSQ